MTDEDLIGRIVEETEADREEIEDEVKAKEEEFAGLVSEEGAIHLVARQYGVELSDQDNRDLKIENIVPGMSRIGIKAKVVRILDMNTFERDDGDEGRVQNVVLGDETGTIRVALWDEQTDLVEKIDEDDNIQIENAYSKEGYRDDAELRIGDSSTIKRIDDDEIGEVKDDSGGSGGGRDHEETTADRIVEGGYYELTGEVVQIYTNSPFYQVCPECEDSLKEDNDYECEEHGAVEPEYRIALPAVIDDGFGNVRCVFFNDRARTLLDAEDVEFKGNSRKLEQYAEKARGRRITVQGRAQTNDYFDAVEVLVNDISEPDIDAMIDEKMEALNDE